MLGDKFHRGSLIPEIELVAGGGYEIFAPSLEEGASEGAANHTAMAGDVILFVRIEGYHEKY